MKTFLIAIIALSCLSLSAAVPDYKAFRGTGGITITSNPPTGTIVIDGSSISAGVTPAYAITNNQTGVTFTNLAGFRQEGTALFTGVIDFGQNEGNVIYVRTNGSDTAAFERGKLNKAVRTITNAVARAITGDLIDVGPGTFTPDVEMFIKDGVTIRGRGRGVTVIDDGFTSLPAALFNGTNNVVFSGLTVRSVQPVQTFGTNNLIFDCEMFGITDGVVATHTIAHTGGMKLMTIDTSRVDVPWDQILCNSTNGAFIEVRNSTVTGNVEDDGPFGANSARELKSFTSYGGGFNVFNTTVIHSNALVSYLFNITEVDVPPTRLQVSGLGYFPAVTNSGTVAGYVFASNGTNSFATYNNMDPVLAVTASAIYTNRGGPERIRMTATGARTNWLPNIGHLGLTRFVNLQIEVVDGAGTAGTSPITIRPIGGALIDGFTSDTINYNGGSRTYVSDNGTNWTSVRANNVMLASKIDENNGVATNLLGYGGLTVASGDFNAGAAAFTGDTIFSGTLEVPTSANPSTTQPGQIGFDNDAWAASRGAGQIYDGTAETLLVGVLKSDAPSNGQVPTYNTDGTITWEAGGSGSPGGAEPMLQMNLGGAFVGTTNLTYDNSNNILRMAASALGNALIDIKDASAPNATNRIGSQFIGMRNNYNFGIRNNDTNNWVFGQAGNLTPATDNYHAIGSPALRAIGAFSTLSNNVLVKPSIAPPGAGGLVHLNGTNNNWFVSATTNVLLVLTNIKAGSDYTLSVSNGANVVVTLSNAAAIKVPGLPAGQFPAFNTNGLTYMTFRIDDISGSTNLPAYASTELSLVAGWKLGMGTNAATQVVTLSVTNAQTLIASNATSVQVDFSAGTPDYYSTDVMRANLSVQPTNLVVGRTATIYLTGDTNANERTVTVITNGIAGGAAIRWFFNTPTNGATSFTVTNTQRAELSLKVLSATEIWAAWSPVR